MESKYSVKVIPDKESHDRGDYRHLLIIKDGDEEREYWDCGEPEDNMFSRDWNWIKGELEKAYQAGLRDAKVTPAPNSKE